MHNPLPFFARASSIDWRRLATASTRRRQSLPRLACFSRDFEASFEGRMPVDRLVRRWSPLPYSCARLVILLSSLLLALRLPLSLPLPLQERRKLSAISFRVDLHPLSLSYIPLPLLHYLSSASSDCSECMRIHTFPSIHSNYCYRN